MSQGAYASVNDIELYYEVHGADHPGLPLIMLHGGVQTFHLSFDTLLPELTKDRQVIGVELQGHGHTADGDRPFSIGQCAADVVALLDHLGIDRADFFGYSLGGLVSTDVAVSHPERVGRVVLAASHFRPDAYYPEITAPEQDSPRLPTEDEGAAMYQAYIEVAPDPDHFSAFLEKIQPAVHAFEPWTDEQLARLTMPILMIIGDTDFVRPEHAVEMHNRLPDSQLAILPATRHMEVVERADLVLPMVKPFLHR
ncbi:alpha/beta fold hydrolase [Actinomadura madurae]|uniref:alpha/beta fold hydrolase n=1 Tax=Actinomadura madurae TaxID=1993 RepID=UPI0020265458|nr:alpha/beta fold hydrolase [Actinomadura madurae]MCP9949571.1 alpha/beta hydrolase [Actinomadura madurae]MCP9966327.1 alpha/beta hydrolase [Actinomadura madurae]MCP9978815.1 alpha/beta hydrolase [Actinomadura madurae]MCQ0009657.1 alpha/beta hydrolase [Actinomadura madurae]MCQ0015003.1 alpha/beta hydrolase [Actinomadura madurae]